MTNRRRRGVLYTGGVVRTMDRAQPVVSAVLVKEGRVAAVGSKNDLESGFDGDLHVVDLQGAVMLPGLIDTHPHLLHYGSLHEPLVDISDCKSHEEIVERIAERARHTKPGEWIMTTPVGEAHYFIRRSFRDLKEGELPTREVLDRATDRHPVVIQAWAPVLPNSIAFNSLALQQLGLARATPDRVGNVWIEKDARGEPTGRLHGSVTNYYSNDEFANNLWLKIPFLKYEYLVPGTKTAIRAYQRLGVTTVYENHMMDRRLLDAYREMRREGTLNMRVLASQEAESYGMPWSRPRSWDDFMQRLEDAAASVELDDDWFRFNGVTLMWDGTCYPGGMMMREAYRGPYGESTQGYYHITPEKARAVMVFCAERRIRLNTMCMGMRANDENLALLEELAKTYDIPSLNWVLIHSVFTTEDQVRRYKRLNFSLTTSMSFCWGKGDAIRQRMGDHVLPDFIALRRFFDEGFLVAGASDWGPKNPWEQIQLANTHEFAGSGYRNRGPAQQVTREEAVSMWTRDAAGVLRWDGLGMIKPGAHADLIVVDRDPVTCPVEDIAGTQVLRTLVAGHVVHDSGELESSR